MPGRICLVTPGHLSTNPRLVKEADALTAAGFRVQVIAARFIPWSDEADEEFRDRSWSTHKVSSSPLARAIPRAQCSLRRRLARGLAGCVGPRRGLAEWALHWIVPELTQKFCGVPADLYIAHNLAALSAAAHAAKAHRAKLVFDAKTFIAVSYLRPKNGS